MTVYQVSIHYGVEVVDTVITEANNSRDALLKVLEARPGITNPKNVYILRIDSAVIL